MLACCSLKFIFMRVTTTKIIVTSQKFTISTWANKTNRGFSITTCLAISLRVNYYRLECYLNNTAEMYYSKLKV